MACQAYMVRLLKDAPLRKPSPIYAGLARRNGRICGGYVRLGTRCYFVTCG